MSTKIPEQTMSYAAALANEYGLSVVVYKLPTRPIEYSCRLEGAPYPMVGAKPVATVEAQSK